MFKDNQLLQQLKAKLKQENKQDSGKPKNIVKEQIKSTSKQHATQEGVNKSKLKSGIFKLKDKGFGFIEESRSEHHYVSHNNANKLLNNQKVKFRNYKLKENKEVTVIECICDNPYDRSVACVVSLDPLSISLYEYINDRAFKAVNNINKNDLKIGDYVVVECIQNGFEHKEYIFSINKFICSQSDKLLPWLVSLNKCNINLEPNNDLPYSEVVLDKGERVDLTDIDFFTIDSDNTTDMDDAINISLLDDNKGWLVRVAIADPSAYIVEGSETDIHALSMGMTYYMPAMNLQMLPHKLSTDICSLHPNKKSATLVFSLFVDLEGEVIDIDMNVAWIESKYKLSYSNVSSYYEQTDCDWIPDSESLKEQLNLLKDFAIVRDELRGKKSIKPVSNDLFEFICEDYKIKDVVANEFGISNRFIEVIMSMVNSEVTSLIRKKGIKFLYTTNSGIRKNCICSLQSYIEKLAIDYPDVIDKELVKLDFTDFDNFLILMQKLHLLDKKYITRIYRLFDTSRYSFNPEPHYTMGLEQYATITSPIRKYSDLFNHRILKNYIWQIDQPDLDEKVITSIIDNRLNNRKINKDLYPWLYCIYMQDKIRSKKIWSANVVDVNKNGIVFRLVDNGANVFVPLESIKLNEKSSYEYNLTFLNFRIDDNLFSFDEQFMINIETIDIHNKRIIGSILRDKNNKPIKKL